MGWFSFEDQTKIRNIDITQMLHVGHVSLQNWLICEEHGDTYSSYSLKLHIVYPDVPIVDITSWGQTHQVHTALPGEFRPVKSLCSVRLKPRPHCGSGFSSLGVTYGGFLKWVYPIAGWLTSWKILLKWMIWGYPHFRKPPHIFLACLFTYSQLCDITWSCLYHNL